MSGLGTGGSSLFDALGVYVQTLGRSGDGKSPWSAWNGKATSLTDTSGNLWLFGGQGKDSTTSSYGLLNDLSGSSIQAQRHNGFG